MADDAHHDIIIIHRHDDEEHEHHSSAWKVAHADFMTAMMAFFLIMWLINVTDDEVKKGISQYFNPVHLSEGQSEMKGLNDPDKVSVEPNGQTAHGVAAEGETAPGGSSAASEQGDPAEHAAEAAAEHGAAAEQAPAAGDGAAAEHAEEEAAAEHGAAAEPPAAGFAPGSGGAAEAASEQQAFEDPYAVLAQLAEEAGAGPRQSPVAIIADSRPAGMQGGPSERDPFDPIYWQTGGGGAALRTGEDGSGMPEAPPDGTLDAGAAAPAMTGDGAGNAETAAAASEAAEAQAAESAPAEAGDEALPAGSGSEAADAASPGPSVVANPGAAGPAAAAEAQALAQEIAAAAEAAVPEGAPAPNISVTATEEGLLVDLTDAADFSMFPVGSAVPEARLVPIVDGVAAALAGRPGDIVIRGFTDGRPYRSPLYDNWRLSSSRAQMAFYMLVRGGVEEGRIIAIEGHADRQPANPDDPYAAENRRIEILLREPR